MFTFGSNLTTGVHLIDTLNATLNTSKESAKADEVLVSWKNDNRTKKWVLQQMGGKCWGGGGVTNCFSAFIISSVAFSRPSGQSVDKRRALTRREELEVFLVLHQQALSW